jgi:hypothetical protein
MQVVETDDRKLMAEEPRTKIRRRPLRPQPMPVEFQIVGFEDRVPAAMSEITIGGALVKPEKGAVPESGKRMRLFVRMFGVDEEYVLRAIVRWERQGAVCVQFFKLGDREVYLLMELIAAAERAAKYAGPTRRT